MNLLMFSVKISNVWQGNVKKYFKDIFDKSTNDCFGAFSDVSNSDVEINNSFL